MKIVAAVLLLWLAGGCQQALAPRVGIAGASPDFVLIAVSVLALFLNRRGGALVGFFGGLVQGAMAGANLAQYVVTRTLAGYGIGWLAMLEFEFNPLVALVVTAASTLFAQLLLMFTAPPPSIAHFLLATIGSAIYNGVLAVPLYALLAKVLAPDSR